MSYVLQSWVATVGLKMQSILLSGLRAPDQKTDAVKKCVRWMRAACQVDADPKKQSYMQDIEMSDGLVERAMDELEYCPVHYAHHFADSMAVLAYHHPNECVARWALKIHWVVATELFHFIPEDKAVFLHRHRDKLEEQPPVEAPLEVSVEEALDDAVRLIKHLGGNPKMQEEVLQRCKDKFMGSLLVSPMGDEDPNFPFPRD